MQDNKKSPATFSILDALGDGFTSFWLHKGALARMALFPYVMGVFATIVLLRHNVEDPSILISALVSIPWFIVVGWYLVRVTRLRLLGEREDVLEPAAQKDPRRIQSIRKGVVYWMLMVLGWVFINMVISQILDLIEPGNTIVRVVMIFFMAFSIWFIRYLVGYIPVSIDRSVKSYLSKTDGTWFPMKMFLMFLAVMFAIFMMTAFFMGMVLQYMGVGAQELYQVTEWPLRLKIVIVLFEQAGYMLFLTLASLSLCHAVDQIMNYTGAKGGQS